MYRLSKPTHTRVSRYAVVRSVPLFRGGPCAGSFQPPYVPPGHHSGIGARWWSTGWRITARSWETDSLHFPGADQRRTRRLSSAPATDTHVLRKRGVAPAGSGRWAGSWAGFAQAMQASQPPMSSAPSVMTRSSVSSSASTRTRSGAWKV